MSKDKHEVLERVLMVAEAEDALDEDQIDSLQSLIDAFKPYGGDPLEDAVQRVAHMARCPHCDYVWPAFFAPVDVSRMARTIARTCVCARCFNNEGVVLDVSREAYAQYIAQATTIGRTQ